MADSSRGYQQFFAELKRRRVFRVMAMYGVVAFIVLQVADIVFPILELPDWTLQFVLMLTLLGFPIAIVLAWALEATDEGIRRAVPATDEELDALIRAPASQRLPSAILALVGVAALVLGAWWVGRQTALPENAEVARASIAVLPCADMSPDGDQAYFSDGIAEELLNLLARIPELHVAARTSSFSFKDQSLEITEIARRLGVAHLLECSVRTAESEVRITAQLVRAHDGFHLWSETWDRPDGDIFAIQEEIASEVVDHLKVTLLGATPTIREANPEAYALYLQARHVDRLASGDSRERAVALYRQALAIDSTYAPAWAGLASVYRQLAGSTRIDPSTGQPYDYSLAQAAVDKALAADPLNPEAHSVLGQLAMRRDDDLEAAARHYRRSIELAPTDLQLLRRAALIYWVQGRLSEDIELMKYVVSRDPLDAAAHFDLGTDYLWAGLLEESIASQRTALSLTPGRRIAHFRIGTALLRMGQVEQALREMEQESGDIWRLIGLSLTYHTLGRVTEADSVLADLITQGERTDPFQIAYVMAWRNESDRAFAWLEKAVEYNDPGLREIAVESLFENIHDDPRWVPFLESIGKSPEQLAAIEFDIPIPE